MKWPRATLRQVAPPERAQSEFADDEVVWHLQLDQVESQTGRILKKVRTCVATAGTATFAFDDKHVLYSKLRPYLNKVVRPDEPGLATTELVPLRPVSGVLDADFLTFYLRSDTFVNFANVTVAGAKMPRMIMDKFWEHSIPLPAPREQRRIVELLVQADALRLQRTEADALASRILPALFRRMFGDPAVNQHGWPIEPLGNFIKVQCGYAFKSDDFTKGGTLLVRIGNLVAGIVHPVEGSAFLPREFFKRYDKFQLARGDLLIALSGATKGKVARFHLESEALINQRVGRFLVRGIPISFLDYLEVLFQTTYIRSLMGIDMQGGGQPNLAPSAIESFAVPRPPNHLIEQFARSASAFREQSRNRIAVKDDLERLFQTMLHRAFTGELTARWREAHIKELLAEMEQQAKALS